jgi:hypothetical protein
VSNRAEGGGSVVRREREEIGCCVGFNSNAHALRGVLAAFRRLTPPRHLSQPHCVLQHHRQPQRDAAAHPARVTTLCSCAHGPGAPQNPAHPRTVLRDSPPGRGINRARAVHRRAHSPALAAHAMHSPRARNLARRRRVGGGRGEMMREIQEGNGADMRRRRRVSTCARSVHHL